MLRILRRLSSTTNSGNGVNSYTLRTHNCGELRSCDVGKNVKLYGWVNFKRMNKFIVLRDAYGTTQLKVKETDVGSTKMIKSLFLESCIEVEGVVKDRGEDRSTQMTTGDIEVEIEKIGILNQVTSTLPLNPKNESSELLRMQHRYLDLRSPKMQRNLRMRSEVVHKMRRFLVEEAGFIDVETPTLFRRTPGGANEFIVPAGGENKGKFYSLPQSPQQFKQLLMVGGIDKYFQIARCYRDEGAKQDRQPEFTQVDLELSFTTQEKVMKLIEELVEASWPEELKAFNPGKNLETRSFEEVMKKYGSDKPDLRIPWMLEGVPESVRHLLRAREMECFVGKGVASSFKKSDKKKWEKIMRVNGSCCNFVMFSMKDDNWFKGNAEFKNTKEELIKSLKLDGEDVVVMAWSDKIEHVQWTLGQLRNHLGSILTKPMKNVFKCLWVVDFPLFESEDGVNWTSTHHPFTAPRPEDLQNLGDSKLLHSIKGLHYDLVINGMEVGGGSIRIHDATLQRHVFNNILKEDCSEITHLLDALAAGAPPHGGFAIGLDRFVSLLASNGDSSESIREVIAFPKSKEGKCHLTNAPSGIDTKTLSRYGIQITNNS
uniref:AA_TRNA_LIGASE_II domain-containing protein n=1 Tax=Rhabditophanes sp. KR3021 TaxID=114890 RepID=A0AC35UFQ7_9BILA